MCGVCVSPGSPRPARRGSPLRTLLIFRGNMRLPNWLNRQPTLTKYEVSKVIELMCPRCSKSLWELPRVPGAGYVTNYCGQCDNTYIIRLRVKESDGS